MLIAAIMYGLKTKATLSNHQNGNFDGVVGCSNNQSNCIYGFFKLPSIRRTSEDEEKLFHQRRTRWLALINRKNLTNAQLSEKNSTIESLW